MFFFGNDGRGKTIPYQEIEEYLGYHFINQTILEQAFIRPSFAREEHIPDYQILEFIGDEVLDNVITRELIRRYAEIKPDPHSYFRLFCSKNEGQLTALKSQIVRSEALADIVDRSDLLKKSLFLSNGDQKIDVTKSDSVLEDLFESLIGAVAVDSDWNYDAIGKTVLKLIDIDAAIKEAEMEGTSHFDYIQAVHKFSYYYSPARENEKYDFYPTKNGFECSVNVFGNATEPLKGFGEGRSKRIAKTEACKNLYAYLIKNHYINEMTMADLIGPYNEDNAINKLQELVQKRAIICDSFEPVTYEFGIESETEEKITWKCTCVLRTNFLTEECKTYGCGDSKMLAKKKAALCMLDKLIEMDKEGKIF